MEDNGKERNTFTVYDYAHEAGWTGGDAPSVAVWLVRFYGDRAGPARKAAAAVALRTPDLQDAVEDCYIVGWEEPGNHPCGWTVYGGGVYRSTAKALLWAKLTGG